MKCFMKTSYFFLPKVLLLIILTHKTVFSQVTVTGANSGNGNYANLAGAFAAINGGVQTSANINISITSNINETFAVLNSGAWAGITINPVGNITVNGNGISGFPLIDFNGADRVTIDGLNSGGNSLTITNINMLRVNHTSTIRFTNDASNNVLTRCTILGINGPIAGQSGVIEFGTGVTTGNDNNLISHCDIGPANFSALPVSAILMSGTVTPAGRENSGDTIRDCNIYDIFYPASCAGIYVSSGNTSITISGNKFFQTDVRALSNTTSSYGIFINIVAGTAGSFVIKNNKIGYANSNDTGFYKMTLNTGSFFKAIAVQGATSSQIDGNIIDAISMSGNFSGNTFTGIDVGGGSTNIGTLSPNIIGNQTDTGRISIVSSSASENITAAIRVSTAAAVCRNNLIGGIRSSGSGAGGGTIFGITATSASLLTFECKDNTVGGTISNSIQSNKSTGTVSAAIFYTNLTGTVTGNLIRNISSAGSSAALKGIFADGIASTQIVSQNKIRVLDVTNNSSATEVTGIHFKCTSSNTNSRVESNYVRLLSGASTTGNINGIQTTGGKATFDNNMIQLGINSTGGNVASGLISCFRETGGSNNIYFNSFYVGGTATSGSANTYTLFSTVSDSVRGYVNNIFYNARSNSGSTGKHYSISIGGTGVTPAGLAIDGNVYYSPGVGGFLARYNSTDISSLAVLLSSIWQNGNSYSDDPNFISPNSAVSDSALYINRNSPTVIESNGLTVTPSVDVDINGNIRANFTPIDIGADAGNFIPYPVKIEGAYSFLNRLYKNLRTAINELNPAFLAGYNIIITISGDLTDDTTITVTNTSWNSLLIKPSGQITVSGNIAGSGGLINLNGTLKVIIDGLNSGGNSLRIFNTMTDGKAITITGNATQNKITNCTILGNNSNTNAVIEIGNSSPPNSNQNNTISFCNIGRYDSLQFLTKAIAVNSGSADTISNCKISDYNSINASSGIYCAPGTSNIIIKDNKLFQSTGISIIQHYPIWINSSAGNNFLVSGNTIGYTSESGTGIYTMSGPFGSSVNMIRLTAGSSVTSNITGNTIAGIYFSSPMLEGSYDNAFRGIVITAGKVNVTGNTIGSFSTNGSITTNNTFGSNFASMTGIVTNSSSGCSITSNNIGGINLTADPGAGMRFYGIRSFASAADTFICSNNIIGGSLPNSIYNACHHINSIVNGIYDTMAVSVITGNVVRNLNNISGIGTGPVSSVSGIVVNSPARTHTISGNSIYNISVTSLVPTFPGTINGIFFNGSAGTNLVSKNFLHTFTGVKSNDIINGILTSGGNADYVNNMVRLGIDTSGNGNNADVTITGINELSGSNNFYFNSIYIGGAPTSGTSNTFAFNSSVTGNTRNYLNNIFMNVRSNIGSTGSHYAVKVGGVSQDPPGLNINNNIYLAIGSGGKFGSFNGNNILSLTEWQNAVGQDENSFENNPQYLNPAGSASTVDLHINSEIPTSVESNGIFISSVADDFDGDARAGLTPVDIGADAGNFTSLTKSLALTMLIQGFYNQSTNKLVRDTIRVYLRNANSMYAIVDSSKGYLDSAGKVNLVFLNAVTGLYYIQLTHRNSIDTWSSSPQDFTASILNYDFTDATAKAFGDNMIQVDESPVRFAIYNGDVNQDGFIDISDGSLIDNDLANFVTGYLRTDLNGDDFIDVSDASIADNNAANFVGKVVP